MSALSIPPGLTSFPVSKFLFEGGDTSLQWDHIERVKPYTNAFIISKDGSKILLGLKKRGFGINKYNGFGGKVEPNETPLEAGIRELKEESGIDSHLEHCGVLLFKLVDYEFAHHVDVYKAQTWSGEIIETEEMRPKWFSTGKEEASQNEDLPTIPYGQMWPDDVLWMPLLLSNTPFIGRVDFGASPSGDKAGGDSPMIKWWFASRADNTKE